MRSPTARLHEERLVASFVVAEKRERWLQLLAKPARRRTVTARLAHHAHRDFDGRWCRELPTSAGLLELLVAHGAPAEAYLVSESSSFDGRLMPLAEALREALGRGMGTIVSCVPGELALFEPERGLPVLLRRSAEEQR